MSIELSLDKEELRTRFHNLHTFEDIATLLDVPKSKLYYYAFKADLGKHYKTFNIPKKSGGYRKICAPSSPLKIIQKKLNQVLQAVYVPKASVHGFIYGRSILSNAKRHLEGKGNKRYIFNLDLKNFFPTITKPRVEGLFSAIPYNLPPKLARVIALLCCYEFKLPQGAPTSPIISNMICAKMDTQLRRFAKDNKCVYTRYADDITFSTTIPSFPVAIAKYDEETNNIVVGKDLRAIIELNGFEINNKKVRLQSKNKRQEITGLTVNKFPNVRRKYVRQIRAMLHAWDKYGLEAAQKEFIEKYSNNRKSVNFKKVLRGKIEFLRMIRGEENLIYFNLSNKLSQLDPDYKKPVENAVLRPSNPVLIVTEGRTDWKHLKAALNRFQLNGEFIGLDIEFFEYEEDPEMGYGELEKRVNSKMVMKSQKINIDIFDRDIAQINKKMNGPNGDYKKWDDRLFTFTIPVPSLRTENPDICLELYYKNQDIKHVDVSGRRLYISDEFDAKSCRHKIENLNCRDVNKVTKGPLKIIDNDVFNGEHVNVALPKNNFASYVLSNVEGFNDFDISEFRLIFNVIQKIIKENPL